MPSDEALVQFEQNIRRYSCRDHIGKPISIRTRFSTQSGQDVDSACGQLAAAATMKRLADKDSTTRDVEDLLPCPTQPILQRRKKQKVTSESPQLVCLHYQVLACTSVMVTLALM